MTTELFKYAAVIPVTMEGEILFHQRDHKTWISNPGKVGMYGGGVEGTETYLQAAAREVDEELGINISEKDLEFFTDYINTDPKGKMEQCEVFLLKNIDLANLAPNPDEGLGYVKLFPGTDISNVNFTPMAKNMFNLYSENFSQQ